MTTFWIDAGAYALTTLVALALFLVVLGMGIRRRPNIAFGLMMTAVALWAATSVILRVALKLSPGTQQIWMEISTLVYTLIAPFMLFFAATYIQTKQKWPYIVAYVCLVAVGLFGIAVFRQQVVANVRLGSGGTVEWDRTGLAFFSSIPLFACAFCALGLLWHERKRLREPFLSTAIALLVAGNVIFSLITVPFPTLSLLMIVVIGIMGYGILNRQLLNPMRELTEQLEAQVRDRTHALELAADDLQRVLLSAQRHIIYLQAAADVARSVSVIRDIDTLLQETVRLLADQFEFYHVGVFMPEENGEYVMLRSASSVEGQAMVMRRQNIRVGEAGVVGQALKKGGVHVVADVLIGSERVHEGIMLPGARSQIAMPLQVGDKILGVLDVQAAEPGAFTEEDVEVLQILASQLAVGLENAQLLIQTRSSLEELSGLYRAATVEAWQQFATMQTDAGHYHFGRADSVLTQSWESLFARARSMGRSVGSYFKGVGADSDQHALAVPVKLRGVTVGVIGFHRPVEAGEWRAEEIAVAEGVAGRMALALENVRLLEETRNRVVRERLIRQVADQLQQATDIEALMRIATEELQKVLGGSRAYVHLESETEPAGE